MGEHTNRRHLTHNSHRYKRAHPRARRTRVRIKMTMHRTGRDEERRRRERRLVCSTTTTHREARTRAASAASRPPLLRFTTTNMRRTARAASTATRLARAAAALIIVCFVACFIAPAAAARPGPADSRLQLAGSSRYYSKSSCRLCRGLVRRRGLQVRRDARGSEVRTRSTERSLAVRRYHPSWNFLPSLESNGILC